jgi:predicted protein tyrosine phosphatase
MFEISFRVMSRHRSWHPEIYASYNYAALIYMFKIEAFMYFAVCSLARLPEVISSVNPSHLLTVMSGDAEIARPETILESHHKKLFFNDITQQADGLIIPAAHHVEDMIAFFQNWDRQAPMVIHCWAGVSRSTASAYVGLCSLMPDKNEQGLALMLRKASPTATPNAKLIEIADMVLGRNGRMIDSVKAIGRGSDCFEGAPFTLSLNDSN